MSHQVFYHSFYAFVARPLFAKELERPERLLSPGLAQLLDRWPAVRSEIAALLSRAVPEAVPSCALNVALLNRGGLDADRTVQALAERYGPQIATRVRPVERTLVAIDSEIEHLVNPRRASKERSLLGDLCLQLSTQLRDLGLLSHIGDADD